MGPVQGRPHGGPEAELIPPPTDAQLLLQARHRDPFAYLGPHIVERDGTRRIVVRAVQTHASEVTVLIAGQEIPAERIDPGGVFEALLPAEITEIPSSPGYRLRIRWRDGNLSELADPYSFPPAISEFDLHLIGEGTLLPGVVRRDGRSHPRDLRRARRALCRLGAECGTSQRRRRLQHLGRPCPPHAFSR